MPTGNAIVDRAIAAHGGEARWREVETITTRWTFRGAMFKLRLREGQLRNLNARIFAREQRVEVTPFAGKDAAGVFRPGRVELAPRGGAATHRDNPRDAFANPRTLMWWTDIETLYFAGYVLWNYAQLPFVLLWPGLAFEDAGATTIGGETWTKVRVTFPPEVATHSPRQTFYFGADGLLRRHDYHVGIMGRLARGARYIHAVQKLDGLIMPSRIEIKLGLWGERFAPFPSLKVCRFRRHADRLTHPIDGNGILIRQRFLGLRRQAPFLPATDLPLNFHPASIRAPALWSEPLLWSTGRWGFRATSR